MHNNKAIIHRSVINRREAVVTFNLSFIRYKVIIIIKSLYILSFIDL
jgi:hypothetical protein